MNRKQFISNAILWAAAILASAIVGAPHYFSVLLLPVLAGFALLITRPKSRSIQCGESGF